MAEKSVLYTKKEHVGYITLNRPESGNFIDLTLAQEIVVVVINGVGNPFCRGGDTRALVSETSPAEAIAGIQVPTIAAVNGDAIGEGLEIALACDMRVASDKARFGLPQIADGILPQDGGTQRLSRIAGRGKALEMVLTGELIDAQNAFETGL